VKVVCSDEYLHKMSRMVNSLNNTDFRSARCKNNLLHNGMYKKDLQRKLFEVYPEIEPPRKAPPVKLCEPLPPEQLQYNLMNR
jgi:hypothetical protein